MLGATAAALVLPLLESRPLAALTTRYNFAARVFSPAEFALVDELSDIIIPTDEVSLVEGNGPGECGFERVDLLGQFVTIERHLRF